MAGNALDERGPKDDQIPSAVAARLAYTRQMNGVMGGVRRATWSIGVFVIMLGILAVIVLASSVTTVQAGYVGVLLTFERAEPVALQPGLYVITPFVQKVVQMDTHVLPHAFSNIQAASVELQTVTVSGTVNYHLDASRAPELYQAVGLDFGRRVIDPALNDYIKQVLPQYQVTEILTHRDQIRSSSKTMLGTSLQRYGLMVDDLYVSDIAFSANYQAAIEQKQLQQQNVEAQQQILAQKQVQAQQAVAEAKGHADANATLNSTLTPQLIEYLRWQKWDGKLPMVSGQAETLVTLPTGTSQPPAASPAPPTPATQPSGASPQGMPTAPSPAPAAQAGPPRYPTP